MIEGAVSSLSELVYPSRCLICEVFGSTLCHTCASFVRLQERQRCASCGKPSPFGVTHPACHSRNTLDGIFAAGIFSQLQPLIHTFKFDLVESLAGPLGQIMIRAVETAGMSDFFAEVTLVPVPLHARRLRWRGFNQSALLADGIAKSTGLHVNHDFLMRIKNTPSQALLSYEERLDNLRGAFETSEAALIKDKKILLIDDIAATGSTLNQAAKTLKQSGAASVWGLVLAHG